jgi:hypothetical protein
VISQMNAKDDDGNNYYSFILLNITTHASDH